MREKFRELQDYLSKMSKQGLCLAYSGGIDSCVLLYLCKDLDVVAVTFKSLLQDDEEIAFACDLCKTYKVEHKIVEYYPLDDPFIKNNPKDRCYYCKKMFFSKIIDFANNRVVIDGTNADDLKVFRPGIKALKELKIHPPFAEFEITKQEIRDFAKHCGIKIYNKPSTPCFATRFPYNTLLCETLINKAKEGEKILKYYGFSDCRFRIHNDIARIEIPLCEINKFIGLREKILIKLKSLNLKYYTLDIEGLRIASMDCALSDTQPAQKKQAE